MKEPHHTKTCHQSLGPFRGRILATLSPQQVFPTIITCLVVFRGGFLESHMHEQTTKEFGKMNISITRFGIRIGDRKYLNEYTPFGSVSLWTAKQMCRPILAWYAGYDLAESWAVLEINQVEQMTQSCTSLTLWFLKPLHWLSLSLIIVISRSGPNSIFEFFKNNYMKSSLM